MTPGDKKEPVTCRLAIYMDIPGTGRNQVSIVKSKARGRICAAGPSPLLLSASLCKAFIPLISISACPVQPPEFWWSRRAYT